MTALDRLRDLPPFALARLADCYDPDTADSPGAAFLDTVRVSVIESWDRLTENDDDPDADGALDEIAGGCVPVYTHDLWATFVDLGAYNEEDGAEFGPLENMTAAARIALYMIATRLVHALIDEAKQDEEAEQ